MHKPNSTSSIITTLIVLATTLLSPLAQANSFTPPPATNTPGTQLSIPSTLPVPDTGFILSKQNNQDLIQIAPSISSSIIKNGEALKISAIVKSKYPIVSATAQIPDANTTLTLTRTSGNTLRGVYETTWTAQNLKEQEYPIILTIKDSENNSVSDRSLSFSDPIAGISQIGAKAHSMKQVQEKQYDIHHNGFENAVIDPAGNYIYATTFNDPVQLLKINLNTFSIENKLSTPPLAGNLNVLTIDSTGNYLYIAGQSNILKIDLSTFTTVGTWDLTDPTDYTFIQGTIDSTDSYLYLTTYYSGKIIKIDLSNLTKVAQITLPAGEKATSLTIDHASNFIYAGTNSTPGKILKIDLSSFTHTGTITLNPGENAIYTSVIDPLDNYGYFAASRGTSNPGRIIKVDLATFSRTAHIDLNVGDINAQASTTDSAGNFAYFATNTSPIKIAKINLATFTVAGPSITLSEYENKATSLNIDPLNNFIYCTDETNPPSITKIDVGTFTKTGELLSTDGVGSLIKGVTTNTGSHSYYILDDYQGDPVVKINNATLQDEGKIYATGNQYQFSALALDPANNFLYLGTEQAPNGSIVKASLSPFSNISTLGLNANEGPISTIVIDPPGNFAYIGIRKNSDPGYIVKVNLNTFTRTGALTLNAGESKIFSGAIDSTGTYAYFGIESFGGPGKIIRVNLATFTHAGTLNLNTDEAFIRSLKIDPANNYLYAGTYYPVGGPANFVKIDLNTFSRVGSITLNNDEQLIHDFETDNSWKYAYLLIPEGSTSKIIKIDLDNFSRVNHKIIDQSIRAITLSPSDNSLFLGEAYANPSKITQLNTNLADFIHGSKITLPTLAEQIKRVRIYAHENNGRIKLGIYNSNKNKVWESNEITATNDEQWITSSIANGTPTSLTNIPSGDYWLTFQTNDSTFIPSLGYGNNGDGFWISNTYGTMPSTITGETLTNEKYSNYMVYDAPAGTQAIAISNTFDILQPSTYTSGSGSGVSNPPPAPPTPPPTTPSETQPEPTDTTTKETTPPDTQPQTGTKTYAIDTPMGVTQTPPPPTAETQAPPTTQQSTTPPATQLPPQQPTSPPATQTEPTEPSEEETTPGEISEVKPAPETTEETLETQPSTETESETTTEETTPPSQPGEPEEPGTPGAPGKDQPEQPITYPPGDIIPPSSEIPIPTTVLSATQILETTGNKCNAPLFLQTYNLNIFTGLIDSDNDGLSDILECQYNTNPLSPDSDNDGISDSEEILDFSSDPTFPEEQEEEYDQDGNLIKKYFVAITSFENNQLTADNQPVIKGIAPANQQVSVKISDNTGASQQLGTVTVSENGKFILITPNPLRDGVYTLIAQSSHPQTNQLLISPPINIEINSKLDIKAPTVTKLAEKTINEEVFLKNLRVEIVNQKPQVIGTTNIGNKVAATWESLVFSSAIVADIASGDFVINSPQILPPGDHTVYLTATRSSDNAQSKTITLPFTIKTAEQLAAEKLTKTLYSIGFWILLLLLIIIVYISYKHYKNRPRPPKQNVEQKTREQQSNQAVFPQDQNFQQSSEQQSPQEHLPTEENQQPELFQEDKK